MEQEKRGVKRKRFEPQQEELSVRIRGRLHHEVKEVHKASKKAKIQETQKVVKKLKDIRKKDQQDLGILEFEAELMSLKSVDHDLIGNSAFKSKLFKDRTLRDNKDVTAALNNEFQTNLVVPGEGGSILAKIQSRLLSSKTLAAQIAISINSLKIILNPELKQKQNSTESVVQKVPEGASRSSIIRKGNSSDLSGRNQLELLADEPEEMNSGLTESEDEAWESGTVGEEENLRDDGWESGSIANDEVEDNDDARSDQELDANSSATKTKTNNIAAPKSARGSSSKIESTFLPSLSVGFVRGSDESDWSEGEGNTADMPKKNRRGQRARRAIWEKKFGRNANHKKKEAEEKAAAQLRRIKGRTTTGANSIPSRKGPHRAPPEISEGHSMVKSFTERKHALDAGWRGRSTDATPAISFRHSASIPSEKNEDRLHPSWEAKRRLKEKERVGIVPSQGTKIKFS